MSESITSRGTLVNSDTRRRVWAIISASSGNLGLNGSTSTSTHFVHSTSPTFSSRPGTQRLSYFRPLEFLPQGS